MLGGEGFGFRIKSSRRGIPREISHGDHGELIGPSQCSELYSSPDIDVQYFIPDPSSAIYFLQAYLMTCVLAALLSSVVSALPVGRGPLFSQPFYGGFGLNPAVRARPAFDGPTFVPVRDEEQISVNDIDAADDAYSFEYNVQADDGSHSRQEARDSDGTVRGESQSPSDTQRNLSIFSS